MCFFQDHSVTCRRRLTILVVVKFVSNYFTNQFLRFRGSGKSASYALIISLTSLDISIRAIIQARSIEKPKLRVRHLHRYLRYVDDAGTIVLRRSIGKAIEDLDRFNASSDELDRK